MEYQSLQKKHSCFTYQNFSFHFHDSSDFVAVFTYQLENGPTFTHQVIFTQIDQELFSQQDPVLINNLIFHLGLVEMLSYWKLAASPTIHIACGQLNSDQVKFWQDLLLHGMGEYFYLNQIDSFFHTPPQFIITNQSSSIALARHSKQPKPVAAINLGGGKDSAAMLSFMTQKTMPFVNLIVQPASPAAAKMSQNGHPTHFVQRQFDPQLFQLNHQNYLNGHVPFSATVAFVNLLAAVLYDYDFALVGNESSADQPSLIWRNQAINHQYSKSTKFEQDFEKYRSQYIIKNVKYCSLLRKFNELEIAQIFSSNPQFFPIFKSCNCGQQKDLWCHHCSKCLFVFLMLSPFIDEKILTSKIFSHNLFADSTLLTDCKKLLGLAPAKPLECVGTIEESQLAFYLTLQKYQQTSLTLPVILNTLKDDLLNLGIDWPQRQQTLLSHSINDLVLPTL